MVHIAAIQYVGSSRDNSLVPRENISFLESFAVQAENTTQAKDTSQSQNTNPDETNIKDRLPETAENETTPLVPSVSVKSTNTTRNPSLITHNTDDLQNSTTPPNAHASTLNNLPPPYPRQSRRLGEQGKVVLAAEIATNGQALQAIVKISSGYPRLDRVALESVLKWQFIPGKKAGVTQKMWVIIPINFVLQ